MMAGRRSASLQKKLADQDSQASEIAHSMPPGSRSLLRDVRELILGARSRVAQSVNASLTMLYWQVGTRIRNAILGDKRAKYGEKVVTAIAARLEIEFGRGFGEKNLRRMIQFAEKFPDEQIVAALLRQLGWTHFTLLLPIKDSLYRVTEALPRAALESKLHEAMRLAHQRLRQNGARAVEKRREIDRRARESPLVTNQ